jgi:hypothetical protein
VTGWFCEKIAQWPAKVAQNAAQTPFWQVWRRRKKSITFVIETFAQS